MLSAASFHLTVSFYLTAEFKKRIEASLQPNSKIWDFPFFAKRSISSYFGYIYIYIYIYIHNYTQMYVCMKGYLHAYIQAYRHTAWYRHISRFGSYHFTVTRSSHSGYDRSWHHLAHLEHMKAEVRDRPSDSVSVGSCAWRVWVYERYARMGSVPWASAMCVMTVDSLHWESGTVTVWEGET